MVSDIFYADQEINFMQITQNRDSARINVVDSLFFLYTAGPLAVPAENMRFMIINCEPATSEK